MEEEELEKEQLDYLRRNYDDTLNIPNEVDMNLDILEKPIDDRIFLSPEQEKKLLQEVIKKQKMNELEVKDRSFSFKKYLDILTNSFIEIMDDLLALDGDLEKIPSIFTKDDRLVLVGTILAAISIAFIVYRRTSNVKNPL